MTSALAAAQDHLARLVAFDTTSRNSNLALIEDVEARLAALGARTRRIPSPEGGKANLLAAIGPEAPGGVVVSGHTDVVPVDGQDWSSDPFVLTRRGDRLYGRGTCDMKGFIACVLAAAPAFAQARLARPLHIALTYDEEVGCLGAPALIAALAQELPAPSAVFVGEPTEMKVVTAHKGLLSFDVVVTGKEAHSSLIKDGACAVSWSVPLMAHLLAEAEAMAAAAPPDSPFDPPAGTLTIGQMSGGVAANILAREARFVSLVRPAPWDDADAIEARLRAKAAEVEAAMRRTAPAARVQVARRSSVPALAPEKDGEAERLARALTGDNAIHVVAFGAEAGQYQKAGFSTVLCGPGSIAQAHQPNEYVERTQLAACIKFLQSLAQRLATD